MPETLTIACPACAKQIKAPAEVAGKKIRCKGCGEVFVAQAGPARSAGKPAGKPEGKPTPPPPKPGDDDDMGDGKPYGVTEEKLGARCPECANAMGENDIVCLKCGYNTRTRQRVQTRRIKDTTGLDWTLWLGPGILCALVAIGLIVWDLLYLIKGTEWFGEGEWYSFLAWPAAKLWLTIISLALIWYTGKFAVKRLILNPRPPEIEIRG